MAVESTLGRTLRHAAADGWRNVTVAASLCPGAGNGVFATRQRRPGAHLCGFSARPHGSGDPADTTYALERPGGAGVLHGDPTRSFGPNINDCRDDTLINAKVVWVHGRATVVTTKRILPGQEIFIDYGLDYWSARCHLLPPDDAEEVRQRLSARATRRSREEARQSHPDTPSPDGSASEDDNTDGRFDEWSDDGGDEEIPPQPPPTVARASAWFSEEGVSDLLAWVKQFFPELTTDEGEVRRLLIKAFELGSAIFGEASANEWAEGFRIPPDAIVADDAAWLACHGRFEDLVREKRRAIDAGRLSIERVNKQLSSANPFKAATLEIATNGIALCTPAEYTGCGWDNKPPTGSTLFRNTAAAVERMMFESYWEEGLSIVLSEERVRTMESLGLCLASWAKKLGKQCGRPITNGSVKRGMLPERIINGRKTRANAIRKYGPIEHPTIGDVARLITSFEKRRGIPRSEVRIWKYDIAAAYQKLSYAVEAVGHVGVELRDGRFMFFLGGVFGLTSMPFAFNVITQAIVWELNNVLLRGVMLQYLDDGFVVSHADEEQEDVRVTLDFIRGLLGADAIAVHKLEFAPAFDFLGWHASLTTGLITIAERNVLKAVYAYGTVDLTPGLHVGIKVMQRLASLASRYSFVCHLLRPYVRTLYSAHSGRSQYGFVILSAGERAVVRTFKHLFTLMGLRGSLFSRSLESFTAVPPQWVCEFDASLSGIGIIWFKVSPQGQEDAVAYAKVDIRELQFGEDASFQNTAEYMGSLLCARGMSMLQGAGAPVLLRGDSVSALTWAAKGSVRSGRACRAAALWAQYAVLRQVNVVDTMHVSHERNTRTDILSRQGSWTDVLREDRRAYGGTLNPTTPELDLECHNLLHLVNPLRSLDSDEEFGEFFRESIQFFDSEQPRHPAPPRPGRPSPHSTPLYNPNPCLTPLV